MLKITVTIIKKIIVSLFVMGVFTSMIFAVLFHTGIIHEFVRKEFQKQLSSIMQQEVTVKRAGGNLLNQIRLYDVVFHNKPSFGDDIVFHIQELVAHFSIKKTLDNNGDLVAAADTLEINNPKVYVNRTAEDHWTIFGLLPPKPSVFPHTSTSFRGVMNIDNLDIIFTDHHGWGETLISAPFQATFKDLDGYLNFNRPERMGLNLRGTLAERPVSFEGEINVFLGQYDLDINFQGLDLDKWGPYILTTEGYHLSENSADIKGRLWAKDPFAPKGTTPYWFDLSIQLNEATLALPFLNSPLKEVNAQIHFANSQLEPDSLGSTWRFNNLVKAGVLDAKGFVQTKHSARDFPQGFSIAKRNNQSRKILNLLRDPDSKFVFDDLSASLEEIPLFGKGYLNLSTQEMGFDFDSQLFDVAQIGKVFQGLEKWRLEGKATTRLSATGTLDRPEVKGVLNQEEGHLFNVPYRNTALHYRFKDQGLHLNISKGSVYDGQLSGQGWLDLKPEVPEVLFELQSHNLHANQAIKKKSVATGNVTVKANIKGPLSHLIASIESEADSFYVFNQHIPKALISLNIQNQNTLNLTEATVYLNQNKNPLIGSGQLINFQSGTFSLEGKNVSFYDVEPGLQNPKKGMLKKLSIQVEKPLRSGWDKVKSKVEISLDPFHFYSQYFESGEVDFTYNDRSMSIHKFNFNSPEYAFDIKGSLLDLKPERLTIDVSDFPVHQSTFLMSLIPKNLLPFESTLSGRMRILKNGSTQKKGGLSAYKIFGQMTHQKLLFQNQPVHFAKTTFNWNGNVLDLKDTVLNEKHTDIILEGWVRKDGRWALDIKPGTNIDIANWDVTLSPYGLYFGKGQINGQIKGQINRPDFNLDLDMQDIQTTFLSLDKLKGNIHYEDQVLSLKQLELAHKEDDIFMSGRVDLDSFISKADSEKTLRDYHLDLKFNQGQLESLSVLLNAFYKEFHTRQGVQVTTQDQRVPRANMRLRLQDNPYKIAALTGGISGIKYQLKKASPLYSFYDELEAKQRSVENNLALGFSDKVSGSIRGYFKIHSQKKGLPKIDTSLSVFNLKGPQLSADSLLFKLQNRQSNIDYDLVMNEGVLGQVDYQKLSAKGRYHNNGYLSLDQTLLKREAHLNKQLLTGYFPLSSFFKNAEGDTKSMMLKTRFIASDIGLLAPLIPGLYSVTHQGVIALNITGPLTAPNLSSPDLNLKDAKIVFGKESPRHSPFILNGRDLSLRNNQFKFKGLNIAWAGPETRPLFKLADENNQIRVDGEASWQGLAFKEAKTLSLFVDLVSTPTQLSVNYPKLYQGGINLGALSMVGTYNIPIADDEKQRLNDLKGTDKEVGPLLSGQVALRDAEIKLPRLGEGSPLPSLLFNLVVMVEDNVQISGNLFGDGAVSSLTAGLDLDVAPSLTPLQISGALSAPQIQNDLVLSRGAISILNRGFELLPDYDQRLFYREEPDKVGVNRISFSHQEDVNSGKKRLGVNLDLKALTTVEPLIPIVTSENETLLIEEETTQYKQLLVSIKGPLSDLDTLYFEHFNSDQASYQDTSLVYKNAYTISSTLDLSENYSASDAYEVVKLLLPDLFVDESLASSERFGELFLGNQLQNILRRRVFRPLEVQLAKRIGVDDLRVNYNLGRALSKTIGGSELSSQEENIGINVTKALSRNMFLRVRSDIDLSAEEDEDDRFQASELALTYYLMQNLSLNYTSRREENDEYKPRLSLNFLYAF